MPPDIARTLAVEAAMPRPVSVFTAKALAIHEVIVSGICVLIVTLPSSLFTIKISMNLLPKISQPSRQYKVRSWALLTVNLTMIY